MEREEKLGKIAVFFNYNCSSLKRHRPLIKGQGKRGGMEDVTYERTFCHFPICKCSCKCSNCLLIFRLFLGSKCKSYKRIVKICKNRFNQTKEWR